MDSKHSIMYGNPFPNHAKKDQKKAIRRNHSPVWWESPERGGRGRGGRRGMADRNGLRAGQGTVRWGGWASGAWGKRRLGGGGSGGAGQPIMVRLADTDKRAARAGERKCLMVGFPKGKARIRRGIPCHEGRNVEGEEAGAAKGAPLS
ncbi:hypothetical protein Bwad005_14900 [Bilophila wadsworthia]